MKTGMTVSIVGILACLLVVRTVGERLWRDRLEQIAGQLQQRHPDWRPSPGDGEVKPADLWRTLVFHPERLPDDAGIRRAATAFRWLAVIRLALLLILLGGLIGVTLWRRPG